MNKNYIKPDTKVLWVVAEDCLLDVSLDPTKDDQNITPDNEEYNGEFGANQNSVWD